MAGVTETGFVTKTEEEVFDGMVTKAKSLISPSLDTSSNSFVGRLLAIVGAELAENWEVMSALYGSQYPSANGQSLDYVCSITGTKRDDPTFSTVTATVNMDNTTAVTAGQIVASVAGVPTSLFENVSAFTAPSTGDHELEFIAQSSGPVQAPSGTLTQLEVTITGVNSITNVLDADPGANQEEDPALRVKRKSELKASSITTDGGIKSTVGKVAGVESVSVLSNRTPHANGIIGPNSFEVVAFGGSDAAIGAAILASMGSGVGNSGGTTVAVLDTEGNSQNISFSRPDEIRVYCDVTLTVDANTYGGDALVKAAIAAYTDGSLTIDLPSGEILSGEMEVGESLFSSQLYNAVYTVSGVLSANIKIGTIFPASGTSVNIDPREIVAVSGSKGIQSADVTVTSS